MWNLYLYFLKDTFKHHVFFNIPRIVRLVATPAARIVLRLQSPLELRSSEWHAWIVAQILGQLGGLEWFVEYTDHWQHLKHKKKRGEKYVERYWHWDLWWFYRWIILMIYWCLIQHRGWHGFIALQVLDFSRSCSKLCQSCAALASCGSSWEAKLRIHRG